MPLIGGVLYNVYVINKTILKRNNVQTLNAIYNIDTIDTNIETYNNANRSVQDIQNIQEQYNF